MIGLVYVNWGRVIVDCPAGCRNAFRVEPTTVSMRCAGAVDACGAEFEVVFPDNLGDIVAELDRRPIEAKRNWYPEGHPIAVNNNIPMDQTVSDLALEFSAAQEGLIE